MIHLLPVFPLLPWYLCYHDTSATMIHLLPWYLCYHDTSATSAPSTTMIHLLPWYICYHDTSATSTNMIPLLPVITQLLSSSSSLPPVTSAACRLGLIHTEPRVYRFNVLWRHQRHSYIGLIAIVPWKVPPAFILTGILVLTGQFSYNYCLVFWFWQVAHSNGCYHVLVVTIVLTINIMVRTPLQMMYTRTQTSNMHSPHFNTENLEGMYPLTYDTISIMHGVAPSSPILKTIARHPDSSIKRYPETNRPENELQLVITNLTMRKLRPKAK